MQTWKTYTVHSPVIMSQKALDYTPIRVLNWMTKKPQAPDLATDVYVKKEPAKMELARETGGLLRWLPLPSVLISKQGFALPHFVLNNPATETGLSLLKGLQTYLSQSTAIKFRMLLNELVFEGYHSDPHRTQVDVVEDIIALGPKYVAVTLERLGSFMNGIWYGIEDLEFRDQNIKRIAAAIVIFAVIDPRFEKKALKIFKRHLVRKRIPLLLRRRYPAVAMGGILEFYKQDSQAARRVIEKLLKHRDPDVNQFVAQVLLLLQQQNGS